jgi:anionic cell wall polymer biosynthesis LytR-Cps2A-Psr (LCP) family protein
MMGIKELVDAVGGVDVNNDLEFTQDGHQYAFGPIHLNGEEALGYIRMRYEDPRGDYGRQLRQRAIVEAVVKKVLTLDGVTQYRNILDAVEGNMKTDLSFSNMQKIALDYRGAFTTIDQLQMQGDGFMQDGISYQRVSENELNSVQNQLKKQLDTK